MLDPTAFSINIHTYADSAFKLYTLEGTGREVLRIGDSASALFYPADLVRLRDAIDAFLAVGATAEAEAA